MRKRQKRRAEAPPRLYSTGETEATDLERTMVLALLGRGNEIKRQADERIREVNAALEELGARAARERGLPEGRYVFAQDEPGAPMVLRREEEDGEAKEGAEQVAAHPEAGPGGDAGGPDGVDPAAPVV